ncbi:hypothetical protein [Marinifilum flexuosum]|uniref:hypothetical protein n=1 Tax=Marinifilum flexuosum TaxID=1117708 RepID=UPI002490CAED|nr:hypothetical protein [Marinifilum flexuosum]
MPKQSTFFKAINLWMGSDKDELSHAWHYEEVSDGWKNKEIKNTLHYGQNTGTESAEIIVF